MNKLLSIGLILSIFLVACNKDDSKEVSMQKTPQISKYTVAAKSVPATIGAFLKAYQSKELQGNMELGEALWNLEAATNYHFRSEKTNIEQRATYTHTFNLPIVANNGQYEASAADIYTAYANALSFVSQALATNNEDEKVLVADFSIISNTDNVAHFEIELISYVEVGKSNQWGINDTDYWWASDKLGKCGPYDGQEVGRDATDRIEEALMYITINAYYWTDIVETGQIRSFYDDDGNSCFLYKIHKHCIEPDSMLYWTNQAYKVILAYRPETNQYMIDCDMTTKRIGEHKTHAMPNDYFHIFENIRYGFPHANDAVGID